MEPEADWNRVASPVLCPQASVPKPYRTTWSFSKVEVAQALPSLPSWPGHLHSAFQTQPSHQLLGEPSSPLSASLAPSSNGAAFWGLHRDLFYFSGSVTLTPKLNILKQQTLIISHGFWGAGIQEHLGCEIQVSQEVAAKMLPSVAGSWRLGWPDDPTANSLTWLLAGGLGSSPLSRRWSWCGSELSPEYMVRERESPQDRSYRVFYNLMSELTIHPSAIFSWSHRPTLEQCGKKLYKGVNIRRWGSWATAPIICPRTYHTGCHHGLSPPVS